MSLINQHNWSEAKKIIKHLMSMPLPRLKLEFVNSLSASKETEQMRKNRKKGGAADPDRHGHYDIDGVSYDNQDGVVVATEPRPKVLEIRFCLH